MANTFWKLPIDHGDNNIWGPKTLKNLRASVRDINAELYDDTGTLKLTKGWIGIDDGTVAGVSDIDTVTTVDISGITSGIWAEIYMSISGTAVTIAAVDIAGATTEDDIPSAFLNSYDRVKGGYYIAASRRCLGIAWKTGGGALSHIINASSNTIDIFRGTIYARDSNGICIKDDDRNTWMCMKDGGQIIGMFTEDVEAWDSTFDVLEFKNQAIAVNNSTIAMSMVSNAYYDGSWKYKTTDVATFINFNAAGTLKFNTAVSGTADTAITWENKFVIDNATDSIGIGGYAGGSNRDCYFYLADDTYFFWDESESALFLHMDGNVFAMFQEQNFGLEGGAGGTNRDCKIVTASDSWIRWDEARGLFEFRCEGVDSTVITNDEVLSNNIIGTQGISGPHSLNNVSTPPTAAQLATAFPDANRSGQLMTINDNDAHTNFYLVVYDDNGDYYYTELTKAT
jgi:hypothetical protein